MAEKRITYFKEIIDRLEKEKNLSDDEFKALLETEDEEVLEYLYAAARRVREGIYGKDVYLRGLIEFTNFCKNNCKYCGIRNGNKNCERYRLTFEQIIDCCNIGYELGFRTFVLQGGEDMYYTDEKMEMIIREIKRLHPDCAITLSIGEKERESFRRFFEAGADRYLLRHETADKAHYEMLHPSDMSFEHRMQSLKDLKEIGYQVGCGMMVGSPYQTIDHMVKDLRFLQDFRPQMVGMGPFIPHHDTEFKDEKAGTVLMTLKLLAIVRLLLPDVLLPATTALGTLDPKGREKGILAGANVVMPNLSPTDVRGKYLLYDNKICTGDEAAECIRCMTGRVETTGYKVVSSRGDHVNFV
ncbi:MAG: [Lachnospiraceae bacterium]|nr:[FeFe] hydrogenase H-cluster radical SAM maturase HydE [Lachnospiraceae bacterium]